MIKRFRVRGFRCLKDVDLRLGRFNVFIGQNDSGKTSLVSALELLSSLSEGGVAETMIGEAESFRANCYGDDGRAGVGIEVWSGQVGERDSWEFHYQVEITQKRGEDRYPEITSELVEDRQIAFQRDPKHANEPSVTRKTLTNAPLSEHRYLGETFDVHKTFLAQLSSFGEETLASHLATFLPVQAYRLSPTKLREPSAATTEESVALGADGSGLPTVLAMLGINHSDRLSQIREKMKEAFPALEQVEIVPTKVDVETKVYLPKPKSDAHGALRFGRGEPVAAEKKSPGFRLAFGLRGNMRSISTNEVSDGVLYYLAFLALMESQDKPRLIAIEEPENGIHPSRLKEVVDILRQLAHDTRVPNPPQVIITTHSPYLLDWLPPEETFVFTREGTGPTNVTCLADVSDLKERLDGFKLGEYWTFAGEEGLKKDVFAKEDAD